MLYMLVPIDLEMFYFTKHGLFLDFHKDFDHIMDAECVCSKMSFQFCLAIVCDTMTLQPVGLEA